MQPLEYPFTRPPTSFCWSQTGCHALEGWTSNTMAGRTPVLAVGSNAAPRQLSRKFADHTFGGSGPDGTIPVTRCAVDGIDVVFAAMVASYGSIPATTVSSPGTDVDLFLTWLTDAQFEQMNRTEAVGESYALASVDVVRCGRLGPISGVIGYQAMAGPALVDGLPIALADIPARDRRFAEMTQTQIWVLVSKALGLEDDVAAIATRAGDDESFRLTVASLLSSGGLSNATR